MSRKLANTCRFAGVVASGEGTVMRALRCISGLAGSLTRASGVWIWRARTWVTTRTAVARWAVMRWVRGRLRVPALVCVVALGGLLSGIRPAYALTDFTWTNSNSNAWSNGSNWVGGTAPSGSVGTLTFRALTGCPCNYLNVNNVSGLSATAISIDDGVGYHMGGSAITLGSGGLTAAPSLSDAGAATLIQLPITLGASQTWSITGGARKQLVQLSGPVTGSADTLGINFLSSGILLLRSDVEAGPVTLSGDGVVQFGGRLNATDGNAVNLSDGVVLDPLYGGGTAFRVGPLTSTGADLDLANSPTSHVAQLGIDGGVTLDSTSTVTMGIVSSGTAAGSDFSQLSATGAVNLGGASLSLGSAGVPCPTLNLGDVAELITTTGSVAGTFAGVPDGTTIPVKCSPGTPPRVKINYTSTAMTATFVGYGNGIWTREAVPSARGDTQLNAVACPSVSECVALGSNSSSDQSLSEVWRGVRWTALRAPRLSGAAGISCLSDTSCLAVGGSHFERWNGSRWVSVGVVRSVPGPYSGLDSLSCPKATACLGIGGYFPHGFAQPLVGRWNGRTWHVALAPTPSRYLTGLASVSCVSATDCIAVGTYFTDALGSISRTFAEHWNGRSWSIQRPPNLPGAIQNYLDSVSCPSRSTCFAVGEAIPRNKPLIERWNGRSWTMMQSPSGSGAAAALDAISCPSATNCAAVGHTPLYGANFEHFAAAEQWNGRNWIVTPIDLPAHQVSSELDAVSCSSAGECTAVGDLHTGSARNYRSQPLVERYSGAPTT